MECHGFIGSEECSMPGGEHQRIESQSGVRRFEDLWIWQTARVIVRNVYLDFGEGTAAEKDFGFRRQIQTAAISIMNNAAEGFERQSNKEFSRFLDIAKGSCAEVRSMYYIAEDLDYVSTAVANERRKLTYRVSGAIVSLKSKLNS